MPVRTDTDPLLSLLADREERSLLSATAITRTLETGSVTGQWVKPLAEHLFTAAIERGRLVHVQSVEVPRERPVLDDLDALGHVELSWRLSDGHDAVLSLGDGAVALLACDGGTCEIVVAGRDPDVAAGHLDGLAAALRADPVPRDDVALRVWSAERKRPRRRRSEDAPAWAARTGRG